MDGGTVLFITSLGVWIPFSQSVYLSDKETDGWITLTVSYKKCVKIIYRSIEYVVCLQYRRHTYSSDRLFSGLYLDTVKQIPSFAFMFKDDDSEDGILICSLLFPSISSIKVVNFTDCLRNSRLARARLVVTKAPTRTSPTQKTIVCLQLSSFLF